MTSQEKKSVTNVPDVHEKLTDQTSFTTMEFNFARSANYSLCCCLINISFGPGFYEYLLFYIHSDRLMF